jgi:pimeloyl-CoA synthetase
MIMDPRGKGPITVELNHTLAELLARLCVELETDDPTGVMSRALGLLEMVQRTKRQGGRLCFINERGEMADVIF